MINRKFIPVLLGITFTSFGQSTSGELKTNSPLRFEVKAALETTPVLSLDDAADDVCVWIPDNSSDPIFIVGTDKKRGLETYDDNGLRVFDQAFGRINNIDLWNASTGPIVVGSNRTFKSIDFYQLNTFDGSLRLINRYKTELDDVYGITVYQKEESTQVFITDKDGTILQYDVSLVDQFVSARPTGSFRFSSTVEGIKGDSFYQRLFVAEEDKGLWMIDLSSKKKRRAKVYKTDKVNLVADLEGVALLDFENGEGYLFVSVQGANSYAIFDRKTLEFIAIFTISEGEQIGAVQETDGIEVVSKNNFSYFIAQDGYNEGSQNYKLVRLEDILNRLK